MLDTKIFVNGIVSNFSGNFRGAGGQVKLKQVWNRTSAYITFKSKHISHVLGNAAALFCCAQSEAKGTVAHITPWMVSAVTFTGFFLSLMLPQLKAK